MLVTNKLSASVTHDLSGFIMMGFWESWGIGLEYRVRPVQPDRSY